MKSVRKVSADGLVLPLTLAICTAIALFSYTALRRAHRAVRLLRGSVQADIQRDQRVEKAIQGGTRGASVGMDGLQCSDDIPSLCAAITSSDTASIRSGWSSNDGASRPLFTLDAIFRDLVPCGPRMEDPPRGQIASMFACTPQSPQETARIAYGGNLVGDTLRLTPSSSSVVTALGAIRLHELHLKRKTLLVAVGAIEIGALIGTDETPPIALLSLRSDISVGSVTGATIEPLAYGRVSLPATVRRGGAQIPPLLRRREVLGLLPRR